ncbi:MAG: hypothetical protein U0797_14190 [Gemmataceae bacterium]
MKRTWLVAALLAALMPVWAASPEPKAEALTGKVVALADVLGRDGGKLDADAAPYWLALRTDDGKLCPLVKDAGSRMFFADKALLNRPMRLTGRLVPGSTLLRVASVNSLYKGELYEVYYWCDICSIKRGEKMVCECCGGPMDLKEEPVKK